VSAFESLEPSRALRALEGLVVDELSNWYIRRSRRRFWDASDATSQAAAFATLHEVLESVVRMLAPVAPFLAEGLWRRMGQAGSVHLAEFPEPAAGRGGFGAQDRDVALESAMGPILSAASLGRAVRERVQIRVRQPLGKLLVHIGGEAKLAASPRAYEDALREELNIKEVVWIDGTPDFLQVRGKANFKTLGKRAGKNMKSLAAAISELPAETLFALQAGGAHVLSVDDVAFELDSEDVLVETVSVEGLEAASDGNVTIGLATELTPELECEGLAREILNRVQTLRKDSGFELSDRIRVRLAGSPELSAVVDAHGAWISEEVLAPEGIAWQAAEQSEGKRYELPGDLVLFLEVERLCKESSGGIA
jgi:isoleucyl-tRNA synthetase